MRLKPTESVEPSYMEETCSERESLRDLVSELPLLADLSPEEMWKSFARTRYTLEREFEFGPYSNELKGYLLPHLRHARELIRLAQYDKGGPLSIIDSRLLELSMHMAEEFSPEELEVTELKLSVENLLMIAPDRLSLEVYKSGDGVEYPGLVVKSIDGMTSETIPIVEGVYFKGGPARVLLDIVSGSPYSMQLAEMPFHDLDAVTLDIHGVKKVAKSLGVDPEGIEPMGLPYLDFVKYAAGRDTTHNQVCFGSTGLHFSAAAFEAASTGITRVVGLYIPNKAIYGVDRMVIDGVVLPKQRGLARLLKFVAEGKSLGFPYMPISREFDMGVWVLYLAKRWQHKDNFNELLGKMYFLLERMGHVRAGEVSIWEVLERCHMEYPFFDFKSEIATDCDLLRWKLGKFAKQVDREAAWRCSYPRSMDIARKAGDTSIYTITLDGYEEGCCPEIDEVNREWSKFLESCNSRTSDYSRKEVSQKERIFTVKDSLNGQYSPDLA